MAALPSRRSFLQVSAGASLLGLGDLGFLSQVRPVSAADTQLDPKLVRLQPDIEPLVQVLEETPREKLIEEVAHRIKQGLTYRELLAALLLAGVRNIQPRPSVGFKFHSVLVVNSAHLSAINSPDQHRWLPLLWAVDNFKGGQARNQQEGGWRMKPVNEAAVPKARRAREAFIDAMTSWDIEAADVAAAGLARSASARDCYDLFARFGCRDFRDIGHKTIYVAGAFRTLETIGWQYAEPVLRSLAYALLKYDGGNPSKNDAPADRPGRRNQELLAKLPPAWLEGKPDDAATTAILETLRAGSSDAICDQIVQMLHKGVSPQSIWDGLLLGAGELLMRQPGIVGLHTLTTANAMHYQYQTVAAELRPMFLLQCAAFLPLFRGAMNERGAVDKIQIDKLQPIVPDGKTSLEWALADIGRDRAAAAGKTLGLLHSGTKPERYLDAARVLIFLKGSDSHDYKFSSSVFEDQATISPTWRHRFIAASTYWLRGSSAKDNALVGRVRDAMKT